MIVKYLYPEERIALKKLRGTTIGELAGRYLGRNILLGVVSFLTEEEWTEDYDEEVKGLSFEQYIMDFREVLLKIYDELEPLTKPEYIEGTSEDSE